MYYEKDWFMRQIDMMVQFVAHTVFHRDKIDYEIADETNLSETDLLYHRLRNLIAENKICEAENLLFDSLDTGNKQYLNLALDFYQTINKMSDEALEACDFSRDEISDGVSTVLRKFQIPMGLV